MYALECVCESLCVHLQLLRLIDYYRQKNVHAGSKLASSWSFYLSIIFYIYLYIFYLTTVSPIEIKNLFFKGDLHKTGINIINTQLQTKHTQQDELK